MPKTRAPVAVAAPLAPTAGSSRITPLLSVAKCATGFCTCWARLTKAGTQPEAGQLKYVPKGGAPPETHAGPQSSENKPTPRIPFAPRLARLLSLTPPEEQLAGIAVKAASPSRFTGMLLAVSDEIVTSAIRTGP